MISITRQGHFINILGELGVVQDAYSDVVD